ncbi:MAG: nucleoside kinase [Syntrophomonadaceae bacterium]|nr:nucleoside kinase [Syntrophomonadaceae bacterium]
MALLDPENANIQINIKSYGLYEIPVGTKAEELVEKIKHKLRYPVVAMIINNNLKDLHYRFTNSCELELVDLSYEIGLRIYRRSVAFILIKACRDLFPERRLVIKHSLSNGLLCEFAETGISQEEVGQIEKRMQQIAAADLPINKYTVLREEACKIFSTQEQTDKVKLLKFRDKSDVHVYSIAGFYEYFYGYMVPRTGMVNKFRVIKYPPGIILQTPQLNEPDKVQPYIEQRKLASIFSEAKDWADMLQTPHVAALNDIIGRGDINDIIRVNEALHEKKIASIADQICQDEKVRLVLISGPSSSGKTTFAQRLLIQLRVNGRKPVSISLDNYFIDRELTPLDEKGDYDFEALEALKLDLFNEHLEQLIHGEQVEIPVYNFKKGCCEPIGIPTRVPAGEPIIIEGIHGLNDRLTWRIPREQKFKIYISALTQLNLDYSNRIPTTDSRLIRRMVRDSRTRGYGAIDTLKRWPSVRRGEERNIFPFQESADVMFNSSLVYELSVLKPCAEPLLKAIGQEHPEFVEAKRLLKFLSYFRTASPDGIPPNSIIREFIGGSWFKS